MRAHIPAMRMHTSTLAALALAAGCTVVNRLRAPRAAPTPAATTAAAPSRPIPYPVFESHAFQRAVARGTRTRTGEPGPKYWQQFARYHIDAELVPSTSQV